MSQTKDTEASSCVHVDADMKTAERGQTSVMDGHRLAIPEEHMEFLRNVDAEEQNRIFRKVDLHVIPMLTLLYLACHIDRANIGNAKIEGLEAELGMTGTNYNLVAAVFLIPYFLFEMPSNMLLMRFKRPSVYLGCLVVSWGTVMTLSGLVQNMAGLAACRALLGLFEAGFFPAAVYLVSKWYPPHRTYWRIAIFYSASAASGAFSGLLAAGIARMSGLGGLSGWRWIFILEGIASVVIGAACFFFLPDSPALASRWLSRDEARFLKLLHDATRGRIEEAKKQANKKDIVKQVVTDWQLYVQAVVFNSVAIPLYGMKFTMPQIVKNLGYSSEKAQLLTAPPYVVAAMASLCCAWFSDKYRWRMPFMVGPQVVTLIGFAVLYVVSGDLKKNVAVAYFCLFIVCAGTYPSLPGINSWSSDNLAGPAKRATGLGFMIMMGNLSGFGGSYIFINSEAPRYPTAYGLSLGLLSGAVVACFLLDYTYWTINKRRDRMSRDEVAAKYTDEELEKLGHRSPLFRYQL